MHICSNCRAQQYEGTIFCTECGASLLVSERHSETTASLGGGKLAEIALPTVVSAPEPKHDNHDLQLTVLNSGRQLSFASVKPLLIGRQDAARGVFPDIDLSNDGGYDAGVSRRHARIWHQSDGFVVEDLQSANGTFINGKRIEPHSPTAIRAGDELGFGTLLMRLEIK